MLKRIYRLPQVMEMTGLSRSSIYLAVSRNKFPKPMKLGSRAIGWNEEALAQWQQKIQETENENS